MLVLLLSIPSYDLYIQNQQKVIFEIVFNIDSDNILTVEKFVFLFLYLLKYLKEFSLVYSRNVHLIDICAIVKKI